MNKQPPTSENSTQLGAQNKTAESAGDSQAAETAVAAYLRSLKPSQGNTVSAPSRPVPGAPFGVERRRSLRYQCEGSAEYRVEGSDVRTWGALHDISLYGCYFEAPAVSPVGTILNMVLEVNRIRVRLKGEVRVSYPFTGMGVAYTDVAEEERAHLRKLLLSLSESHAIKSPLPAAPQSPQPATPITDPAAAVQALVRYFQGRTMLSRQDFWELLRKSQTHLG